jgi:hypothetical protein
MEPWNFMTFQYFPYIGNVISNLTFIFLRGIETNNQKKMVKHVHIWCPGVDANPVFVDGPCLLGQGLDQVVQAGTPKHRSIGMGVELVSEYMFIHFMVGLEIPKNWGLELGKSSINGDNMIMINRYYIYCI